MDITGLVSNLNEYQDPLALKNEKLEKKKKKEKKKSHLPSLIMQSNRLVKILKYVEELRGLDTQHTFQGKATLVQLFFLPS